MAWVRIHDGALTHPRVVGIVDWKAPFCVWVWGLSYCQLHLTDGIIPKEAIPNPIALKSAERLTARGLWLDDGERFKVRDYLQWNDSRETVSKKRESLRQRVTRYRRDDTERTRNASAPSGVIESTDLTKIQDPERESERKPSGLVAVRRIFLHRWQLDALIATLGPHAPDFGLDDWIEALNDRAAQGALPRDPWKWVQSELHAEIARRGLAVVEDAPSAPTNKRIAGLQKGGEAFLRMAAERKAREIGQ